MDRTEQERQKLQVWYRECREAAEYYLQFQNNQVIHQLGLDLLERSLHIAKMAHQMGIEIDLAANETIQMK